MKRSYAIKVPIKSAQEVNSIIKNNYIRNKNFKIKKTEKFIYFPIKKNFKKDNLQLFNQLEKNYKLLYTTFKEQEKKIQSYKENLDFPRNLKKYLPTSYDIIGNIALIKLPTKIIKYKKIIGKSILNSKKNIKTVCLVTPVKGELRLRNLQVIAGEKQTKTTHKEFGLTYCVDVKNTYFSPRLANERKRISNLVKPNEIVVDMFTGVAPFPIMIAKNSKAKMIFGIDKNKKAISLAKQNIKNNKVIDKIILFNDDSKNIKKILKKKQVLADRIIMNLPFSAHSFFKYALDIISKNCVIHYYTITEENKIKNKINTLKNIAKIKNIVIMDYNINKIKQYSPREFYIGIDITVKK